ncbi:MAG TPA: hypothetical protein VFZ91_05610 [Allosphingosinicella sp.]
MKARTLGAIAACACLATSALAEKPTADPAIVPLFEEACLNGGLSLAAREAAMAASGWETMPAEGLKLKPLEPNPMNGDFAKPETVRQWRRSVGGREVRAVLATFRTKGAYPTACILLVPDVQYSWPYWDAFGHVLKPLGVKAKETDLPHYRAYSGKLADGRKARANIMSRSAVEPGSKKLMHLLIAF